MRTQHGFRVFATFVVVVAASGIVVGLATRSAETVPTGAAGKTLDNLQAAFDAERNGRDRYFAFAKKADQEGYGEVASLFRGAAAAEDVHASNHAALIKKLGGIPTADVKSPDVKTTRQNLEAAIRDETGQHDTMYPEFLDQARKDGNQDAIEILAYAKTAEGEHARLYAAAMSALENLKGSKPKGIYVCTVCGYTTTQMEFEKCPSCSSYRDRYVKVS